jgi:hypothetical protein
MTVTRIDGNNSINIVLTSSCTPSIATLPCEVESNNDFAAATRAAFHMT